jgi:hypothetical protein
MDFLGGFPIFEGCQQMMVIVEIFSKYAIYIAEPSTCLAGLAAKLFFTHMVKIFGLPKDIVSDRDPRFTRRFWTAFNLKGNHPQINGQTEMVNALLEDYLRHYASTSQKNWL